MNKNNFEKYQSIINRLRGLVNKPDFEKKFNAATKHLPNSERFLLKMELKRLAAPCTRLIDLRGHVTGECRPYEHDGRIHFLDDEAIKVFEENLAYYEGYTFGVYEATMNTENNFRVMYQKEKQQREAQLAAEKSGKFNTSEKLYYPATFLSTRVYHDRKEERMLFAIPVIFYINDTQEIKLTSSDISPHGLRVKASKHQHFHLDQSITIRFVGLEQEFHFGNQNTFSYVVRNIHQQGDIQLIGLERIDIGEKDSFLNFLQGFIQGNKRRYKINLENTIEALKIRTFEHFAVPKVSELPVYLINNNGELEPRYALTCANNQPLFQYWLNEKGQQTLCYLLNSERINRVIKAANANRSLIVYCFTHHSHGHTFFYTADHEQLKEDSQFAKQYLRFASAQKSFKVLSLQYHTVHPERGYTPYTLANTLAPKDEYLNLPLSDEVKAILADLPGFVTISDFTSEQLRNDYSAFTTVNIDTSKIKQFGHKPQTNLIRVDEVGLNYKNHRQEPRFIYSTPVSFTHKKINYQAYSKDFSTSGICIASDIPIDVDKGDVLKLTFDKLQQITTSFSLKDIPYEVVRVNKSKTIINMKVFVEKHQHIGRSFFRLLINKNKDKLKTDEYALMIPGLSKALRNIYSRTMTIPSLMIQSSGSRYKTEVIIASELTGALFDELQHLSNHPQQFNLYPLLSRLTEGDVSDAGLKKMLPKDPPVSTELYIAINSNEPIVNKAVSVKFAHELETVKLKKIFIQNALKKGQFFCLKLVLSRTEAPDMAHLNPELSYIGSYLIHRAKQLEQQIWSVSGTLRCYDMTEEAMLRFHYT